MGNTRLHGFVVSNSPGKGASLDKSAAIELADTDRGLLINRLTTTQRDAIQGAPNGLLIFNSDTDLFEYWGGNAWIEIDAAGVLPIDLASQVSGNLGVAHLDSGTNASSSTVWAGDGSWKTIDLSSDVTGNLGVAQLNSGTDAGSSTFWSGDGTWKAAGLTTDTLTTGASPVTASTADATNITSGGTGDVEIINLYDLEDSSLPPFAFDATLEGKRHTFVLQTQTDPGDVVQIHAAGFLGSYGNYDLSAWAPAGQLLGTVTDLSGGIILDYAGASITFVWKTFIGWTFENQGNNTSSSIVGLAGYVPPNGIPAQVLRRDGAVQGQGQWGDVLRVDNYDPGLGGLTISGSDLVNLDYVQLVPITGITTPPAVVLGIPISSNRGNPLWGKRITLFYQSFGGGDTNSIELDVGNIQRENGGPLNSISFDTDLQFLILELWDATTWRVVRGTANIT